MCLRGIDFLQFYYWIIELFQHCGIFVFYFINEYRYIDLLILGRNKSKIFKKDTISQIILHPNSRKYIMYI